MTIKLMIKARAKTKMLVLAGALICLILALLIFKPIRAISGHPENLNLMDTSRDRLIPVLLYSDYIHSGKNVQVVIVAHGHGIKNSDYSYISTNLEAHGYVVASVQYELPEDEEININGNAYEILKPVWEEAAKSTLFVVQYLKSRYPNLDCQNLILIGHSRGADMLMLFAQKYPELVSKVISLDNGHMPFLKTKKPQLFLLRANNTKPDSGVLPTPEEQKEFNIKIVNLKDVSHIEMCFGNEFQMEEIKGYIIDFLKKD
jgi:hypothetical protein